MPTLDVSELLTDDLFTETVTVLRRKETLVKGRPVLTVTTFSGVLASIQPKDTVIGGNFVERAPDMEYRGSNLIAYTKFRLRGVALQAVPSQPDADYQPDVVIWNGDHFLVGLTNDFSHFGAGYMQAELVSTEAVDYAPDGAP
jgi:hypothetical protein